jgi:hypothetical protein
MGDRCYMELTCRNKDKALLEAIGFTARGESYEFPNCLEMVDYEANYAHAEDMPKDLVYFGSHDGGDGYRPESFACDGKTYLEQATDGGGGFIVMFDEKGDPIPTNLAEVKTFITHCNNVRVLLAKRRPGKRANARLAEAPTFQPSGGKIDATKP